jgi:lipoprotein-anchoring transpeptidase ErfK/SrfK
MGSLAKVLVVLLAAFVSGCGLFGKPSPPPAPTPVPSPTPHAYLLLKLEERRVYLVENEVKTPPEGYKVAIGQPKWPTPIGKFQVNEMVENPDFLAFDFNDVNKPNKGRVPPGPNNPLGLRWIGFANAHGWQVGFHGTSKTKVLGQAVSHGCVRMANDDIVKLYPLVKVGTEVIVEP